MRIAITGASGDIGGSLLAHVAEKSAVNALVRHGTSLRTDGKQNNVSRFEFQDGYIHTADLMNAFADCDALVHCAALLNTGGTLVDYFAVNTLLTGLLAAKCIQQNNAPKLLYISSSMVYSLPATEALDELSEQVVAFCKEQFEKNVATYDLGVLAKRFFESLPFKYDEYNPYAVTKYLGEAIVRQLPGSVILRITNAYGPDYGNMRFIPRLIKARLTGHGMTYVKETRDFVYSQDINRLIDTIISTDFAGVVDCMSGEQIKTEHIRDTIVRLTPTAYGALRGKKSRSEQFTETPVAPAGTSLSHLIGRPMPFSEGLAATLRHHKEQTYHEMDAARPMEDFLRPGEKIVRFLHGSSAAYLCIVADENGIQKVRKIAIRDGVEGNGIAKVANEIRYYKHIARYEPTLATMYPKLFDAAMGDTFSSETIEYLGGQNYYASLKSQEVPFETHKQALRQFIDTLCDNALQNCVPAKDAEGNLIAYYLERSITRLQPIAKLIEVKDSITINGERLQAPHVILQKLIDDKRLWQFITPRLECFCFHGDLTLLNTVYVTSSNTIKLIDPRGHTGTWDPLYDFGKIKFTLSGFGEFILGSQEIMQPKKGGYEVNLDTIAPASRQLNESLLTMLAESKPFSEGIIEYEPYWRHRIALAEATHFLADIPFRLFTDDGTWSAIASYVLGTLYLNQFYEALLHTARP